MSLFTELQRRNVIRVGIAYVVAAWVLLQVADLVLENIGAPDWVIQAMMLFVVLGFIAALVVAWAYELTPEGIRRERDVDSGQSITHQTGRKLDRIIIGFLAVAVAYFFWEARFAGDAVTPVPDDTAPTARESEAGGPTASTPEVPGTAAAAANSIAVLPFANRSRLEDDEFFTDGIHDDLLTQLAKVRDLKVISRTSMTKYKGTTLTIPEIASELQVATILEGGVQRAGKRIRINAQLIDVATDEHLWAETYDREMTMENIFDIQSEITRRIVSAVRGELTAEESQAIGALPTSSVAAYEAYLKARAFENMANYAQENFVQAQPWAEMAVQLDPQFAQAWALLARLHGMAIWMGYDNTEARRTAMSHAVETAKRLAPDEPWSLVAEAEYLYRVKRDFPASLAALQEAHAALPGDVDILEAIALAQRRVGLWEESVDSALQSVLLDPARVSSARLVMETLSNMREWDRMLSLGRQWQGRFESTDMDVELALAHVRQSGDLVTTRRLLDRIRPVASDRYAFAVTYLPLLERNYPAALAAMDVPEVAEMAELEGWVGWREMQSGFIYSLQGDHERSSRELLSALDKSTALGRAFGPYDYVTLASVYTLLGENAKALESITTAARQTPESLDALDGTGIASARAWILGMTGRRDEALTEIERLLDTPSGLVRWYLYLDPYWDFFRDDERFNELVRPPNPKDAGP